MSSERSAPWPGRLRLLAGLILLVAAGLRLWDLDLKPLHHDEGVNGFFLNRLVRDGDFRYDPTNYHGPTLYYTTWLVTRFTGLTTFGIRATTALAGLGCVGLMLLLGRAFPLGVRLGGAALLAVSPGAVYFSRYYIHETLVMLFTLGIVVAWWRWLEDPRRLWLLWLSACAALLIATKETSVLHVGVLVIAWALSGFLANRESAATPTVWPTRALLGPAVAVFAVIHVTLFTSFFTNWQGLPDSVRAFAASSQTGASAHVNPWSQHLSWLQESEPVQVALAGLGLLLPLIQPTSRALTFTALWTLGVLAAYSAVPYKTPWLGLNAMVPACLLGGFVIEATVRRWRWSLVPVALAIAAAGEQARELSFVNYDDERLPYVYAHTSRGFLDLVRDVEALAAVSGVERATPITVTSAEHWPLPWYLREYTKAGYYGEIPERIEAAIVIGHLSQDRTLAEGLGASFRRVGSYPLRPGADLVLYAHWELDARRATASPFAGDSSRSKP